MSCVIVNKAQMECYDCTYSNLPQAFRQLSLALNVIGRQEPIVILGFFIVCLAKYGIVGVVVITVHFIDTLLALPRLGFVVPEIKESNGAPRLDRAEVCEISLYGLALRGSRRLLHLGIFQDTHLLQLAYVHVELERIPIESDVENTHVHHGT